MCHGLDPALCPHFRAWVTEVGERGQRPSLVPILLDSATPQPGIPSSSRYPLGLFISLNGTGGEKPTGAAPTGK